MVEGKQYNQLRFGDLKSIEKRNSVNPNTVLTYEGDYKFEYLRDSLDSICSEIAAQFNLHYSNGEPRVAAIIDIISSTPCIKEIIGKLQQKYRPSIDAIYLENHKLAVGILIEKLNRFLADNGHNVSYLTEAKLNHGTIDVLINSTNYGVNIQHNGRKIIIEVKTGKSLSYSQLFRYLMDVPNAILILWRIKHRQVAVLHKKDLLPMLRMFVEMCILRGERVLASKTLKNCNSVPSKKFNLSSKGFENTVNDFAEGLTETLPIVLETVLREMTLNEEYPDDTCPRMNIK